MTALTDLIARRSSSGSALEKPSVPTRPEEGESQVVSHDQEATPVADAGVPGGDPPEGFSSVDTPLEEVSEVAPDVASSSVEADPTSEASSSGASKEKEPYGVHETETPTGIGIYYQAGPKRLYRIRKAESRYGVGGPGGSKEAGVGITPAGPWLDVPSVSDILGVLDKPGLPWWGMKVGVAGVLALMEEVDDPECMAFEIPSTVEEIVELLTKKKLTVNHVRDQAGDRGTEIHDSLELWADKGILPNPDVFGPDKRGYVEGLRQFIIDSGAEALRYEVMVASVKLKFAGRYDLGATLPEGARVVVKSYPKKKSVVEPVPGGDWMLDLKTSKGVYESHHFQLAGYNFASAESYGIRYPYTGVIHVFDDGRYELVRGKANDANFRAIKKLYDVMKKLK